MYSNASRFTNVRQIDKIVQEFIDLELVNNFIETSSKTASTSSIASK